MSNPYLGPAGNYIPPTLPPPSADIRGLEELIGAEIPTPEAFLVIAPQPVRELDLQCRDKNIVISFGIDGVAGNIYGYNCTEKGMDPLHSPKYSYLGTVEDIREAQRSMSVDQPIGLGFNPVPGHMLSVVQETSSVVTVLNRVSETEAIFMHLYRVADPQAFLVEKGFAQ